MNQYGKTQCATNLAACTRNEKHAGNDTIELILSRNNLKYRRATYARAVFDIRQQKKLTEQDSLREEV